jgi:hypothetical protein
MLTATGQFADPLKRLQISTWSNFIGNIKFDENDPLNPETNDIVLHRSEIDTTKHGKIPHYHIAPRGCARPEDFVIISHPMTALFSYDKYGVGSYDPDGAPCTTKALEDATYLAVGDGHAYASQLIDPTDPMKRSIQFLEDIKIKRRLRLWTGYYIYQSDIQSSSKSEIETRLAKITTKLAAAKDPAVKEELERRLEEEKKEAEEEFMANGTGVIHRRLWKKADEANYKDASGNALQPVHAEGVPAHIQEWEVPYTESMFYHLKVRYNPNGLRNPRKRKDPRMCAILTDMAIHDRPKYFSIVRNDTDTEFVMREIQNPNFTMPPGYVFLVREHWEGHPNPAKPNTELRIGGSRYQKCFTVSIKPMGYIVLGPAPNPRADLKVNVRVPIPAEDKEDPVMLPSFDDQPTNNRQLVPFKRQCTGPTIVVDPETEEAMVNLEY